MNWQETKELLGMITGLVGVCLGAWLAPYVTSHLEKVRIRKTLKPELIKSLFSYYKLLKEKAEIVNTLSMDERAAVLIGEEIRLRPSDKTELEQKRGILLEKMIRKNMQNDHVSSSLTDAESGVHSLVAQIGVHSDLETYNKCIDILSSFFQRVDKTPYLHDYINLTKDQYNDLAGDRLQKQ